MTARIFFYGCALPFGEFEDCIRCDADCRQPSGICERCQINVESGESPEGLP